MNFFIEKLLFILLFPFLLLLTCYLNLKFKYFPIDEFIIYKDKKIIKKYKYFPNLFYYLYSFKKKNDYEYKIIYYFDNL